MMITMRKSILTVFALALAFPTLAQQKSAKRGVCWDEKTQALTEATVQRLAPGVSWVYNWGTSPVNTTAPVVGPGMSVEFAPMCWNGSFNETALRNYLSAHPGVKYLLGFNEPNISWTSGGSSMTPQQAADAWPRLEKIAADFGLKLVAPALNFSGDNVGGTVYSTPYDWLEAFLTIYPTARMDYLCLHCYMDYATAVNWFATEYFYKDIYSAANQAKYPKLVSYLQSHGELPLFLTEFCAMGNDFRSNGLSMTVDLQIDHMTQKLQYLEKSPKVAGYAWFMANGNASSSPYWSLMQTNTSTSNLSEVGKVYVYMSGFDTTRYYVPGTSILAKDYVDASVGDQQVKLRSNSDVASADIPLQVEMTPSAWAAYQVELPSAGQYSLTLHAKSTAANSVWFYVDGKKTLTTSMASTGGAWTDNAFNINLPAGRHRLMVFNASATSMFVNSLSLNVTAGVSSPVSLQPQESTYFAINGTQLSSPAHGICIERSVSADGTVTVRKVNR